MPNLIEFVWERPAEGYEIVWRKHIFTATLLGDGTSTSRNRPELKPKSAETISYSPLDAYPALFKEFAALDESPQATLAFANEYGLISDGVGPDCEAWYSHIKSMRDGIAAWEQGAIQSLVGGWNAATIGRTDIKLVYRGKEDLPSLALVPNSLLSAMYLQLAQAITRNNALQSCLWCGTWFLYGAGTGRRRSAHYCSDNCRKGAHRDRKEGSK